MLTPPTARASRTITGARPRWSAAGLPSVLVTVLVTVLVACSDAAGPVAAPRPAAPVPPAGPVVVPPVPPTVPPPSQQPLVVHVVTTGTDLDYDGYVLTGDVGSDHVYEPVLVAINATVTVSRWTTERWVELQGVALNCGGPALRSDAFDLNAPSPVEVTFRVVCR